MFVSYLIQSQPHLEQPAPGLHLRETPSGLPVRSMGICGTNRSTVSGSLMLTFFFKKFPDLIIYKRTGVGSGVVIRLRRVSNPTNVSDYCGSEW